MTEGFDLTALLVDIARIAQRDVHLFADGKRELLIMRVDIRRGGAAVTGRFCVIGSKLNEQALKELFEH